jgi:chemotaxis protein MotB
MLNAFNRTLLAVVYLLLFVITVTSVWAISNEKFRDQLANLASPYISGWIADRPEISVLKADLESSQSVVKSLQQENAELRQQLEGLSQQLVQATVAVEQSQEELDNEFSRLKEELDKEVTSREIAIEQVKDRFTVIRVGDKILFDTGSSQLKQGGQQVLGLIANTLRKFTDRQVRVEGHTDDLPIVSSRTKRRYPTNWELSSARATSAVRYLIENGGLDPTRIIAVGLGEYHPIADNDSNQGRAKNRRIEIVLMPTEDNYQVEKVKGL